MPTAPAIFNDGTIAWLADGFEPRFGDNVARFAPQQGSAITRPGAVAVADRFRLPMRAANADYATFKAWFDGDLKEGALSFDWTPPPTLLFLTAGVYKFLAVPVPQPVVGGLFWRATFELERLPG